VEYLRELDAFGDWSFGDWSHSEIGRILGNSGIGRSEIGRSENGRSEIGRCTYSCCGKPLYLSVVNMTKKARSVNFSTDVCWREMKEIPWKISPHTTPVI
jgi:hypothetical protein